MALTWPLAARSQPLPGKVARIGYLGISNAEASAQVIDATVKGFSELGYVRGKHYVMEYRWAEGQYDRLPALAAELVASKLDVIIAPTNNASVAAKAATSTIPLIIITAHDPVRLGLADSLARPGGNVTGLSLSVAPEIVGKRLELLKEAVPSLSRVAVLKNEADRHFAPYYDEARSAAARLGLGVLFVDAATPADIDRAFQTMTTACVDGVFVLGDTVFWMHRGLIADLARQHRLPASGGFRAHTEVGGLMSYGPSIPDNHRRSAAYIDKILRGAKPADLPIEQPTKFELIVNLVTAKELGIAIPESVLARTDEVIE
jgi:putative ABC transport system substrate-binding protein